MESKEINNKVVTSVKWSSLGEVAAKFITPFTSMILARLITPEEFGVIATVNMVSSFADIFIDAGFQKYLIQKTFKSQEELENNANVAFWTNIGISLLIWIFIFIFSEQIAIFAGNPGLGNVIIISSVSIIFVAFSSMQTAIYKKKFDFKILFGIRMLGVVVPVIVTVPLALKGFSYWSVIVGTLVTRIITAIVLTWKSDWKPKVYFNTVVLKSMFSFSIWILIESILLWMTSYCDIFLLGQKMDSYYLGLYKNSITIVNGLFNIIVSATSTVLLSALAAIKENDEEYNEMFFSFQRIVGMLLIPIGVGILIYRDLVTDILLGNQWQEASLLVGLWGLVNSVTILTGQYISIIFTSKGRPKLAVLSQILQLVEMIPLLLIGLEFGFTGLVITRCIARVLYGVINLILAKVYLKMSIFNIIKNLVPSIICSFGMGLIGVCLLQFSTSVFWKIVTIFIDVLIYLGLSMFFKKSRQIILSFKYKLIFKR